MPYKRKDSPIWWVSYTDASGRRLRRSTGTTDRKEAAGLEAKWKLEAFRLEKWDEEPTRMFDELMLAYLQGPSLAKRSSERDRSSAKHLFPFFTGRELAKICGADVRAYIAMRQKAGVVAGTINKEIALIRGALNWARKELEWDVPNAFAGRKLREPPGRMRWLTRPEAACLITAAGNEPKSAHLVDFIVLSLHTGMRSGELLGLEWSRVDLQANLVYLHAEHQKNGKIGSVPINRDAREALRSRARFRATHCPGSPWVFAHESGERLASIHTGFYGACRRAGITDFRPHDLRHTCAAWLVQAGVPIREVAEVLRHSDIRITMRYAHLAPENARAAVSALESDRSRFGHAVTGFDRLRVV
ncbi:tyrosine-type recombinase/integrase [Methylolobus aquaticus]